MNESERALCAATSSLLQAGRVLAHWSLALSALAALALILARPAMGGAAAIALALAALLGLPERYAALRVRLDAALFDGLATQSIASPAALDEALAQLRLRPVPGGVRPLAERALGARRWLWRHGALVLAQTFVFALAIFMYGRNPCS